MKPDEMPEAPVSEAPGAGSPGSDTPVSEAAPGVPAARRPRVVIAGRPNVGKSTLFNRLYGRRRAITDPLAGVTRDAIGEDCSLAGMPITLIDTGGVKAEYEDDFDEIVSHRALGALDTAHLILFVVEIGVITPEDEILIETLRKVSTRVIPVANKADTPEKDYLAAELYARGIGDPLPVSAAHGRGINELTETIREHLENTLSPEGFAGDSERPLVMALVGRPNAGKSTLANRLGGGDHSLVSPIPGTTRDTVIAAARHRDRPLTIIDTAGIRRKARVAQNIEYYSVNRAIRAMFEADVTVLLVDSAEGLSEQDKKITAQAVKKGRTVVMALNKWDEAPPNPQRLKKAVERVRFQFPVLEWAPLLPISALKGIGLSSLLDTVFKADRQQNRRVDTAELNRAVSEWVDLTPPPTRKGRPFKVKYITQISARPVRFACFVNRITGFPDSYRRFLINRIRREFGFDLVPVELLLREGRR